MAGVGLWGIACNILVGVWGHVPKLQFEPSSSGFEAFWDSCGVPVAVVSEHLN